MNTKKAHQMTQERPTLIQFVPEIQRICTELESLAHQTAAHRRKFQFAVNQFHQFSDVFSQNADNSQVNTQQISAYRFIIEAAREYHSLFGQNMLPCWAHSALENKSSSVASDLCGLASKLREVTSYINKQASLCFDAASPQWLQYHILDLKAIASSLSQYQASPTDPVMKIMTNRLHSIDNFIRQYETDQTLQNQRTFSPIPVYYQAWRLNHDDLDKVKEVGSGISAIVYFGYDRRTGQEVAIKKLKFKKLTGSKLQAFQRELAILATAQHPALLKFVGATDTPPFCIVTEWMPNNSLYHDIHKYHYLDATKRTIAAYDIARGMRFLHGRQIIHRDLKSLNVLIDKNLYTRICDFGLSRHAGSGEVMTKNIGTPHWMAPELLDTSGTYDYKIDVYAYAIVCWELLTCQLPFQGMEPTQIVAQVLVADKRPTIPSNCPDNFRKLIEACWQRDPTCRPSFDDIIYLFKNKDIFIEGANMDEVRGYINENTDGDDKDETNQEIEANLNSKTDDYIQNIVETIEKDGVPKDNDLMAKCWEILSSIDIKDDNNTELLARGLIPFLSTLYNTKAAELLRKLPNNLLKKKLVLSALSTIPSGNEKIDTELIIFACKQHCAADAAIHALQPSQQKIALEVCAQEGRPTMNNNGNDNSKNDSNDLNQSLINELAQLCISIMSQNDQMLIVSALRCLVVIKEAKRISLDSIKMYMQSKNNTLKYAAYVAASAMAIEGVQLPNDLIDAMTVKWEKEPLSIIVTVAGCKNLETAKLLVNRLAYGEQQSPEISVRILIASSIHEELSEEILSCLDKIDINSTLPEVKESIIILKKKLQ